MFFIGVFVAVPLSYCDEGGRLTCTVEKYHPPLAQLRCPLEKGKVMWVNTYLDLPPEEIEVGDEISFRQP